MKKIGLITFHLAYNYGARLQAYALFHKLELLGYDCTIVKYETSTQRSQYKTIQPICSIKDFFRLLRNLWNFRINRKRKLFFDNFSNTHCRFTASIINKDNLQKTFESFDLALVGSDQVWNIKETIFDDAYLLPFPLNIKKVSYASSTGDDVRTWNKNEINIVTEHLQDFDFISVREYSGQQMLQSRGITATQVLDPTLLLNKSDWDQIKSNSNNLTEDYILFYTVKSSDFPVNVVKNLSKDTNLKIVAIHPKNSFEIGTRFIRKMNIGPESFIELISKAKYVVTTSFHATVFSIIYNKLFICPTQNERIIDLLDNLGVKNRTIKSKEEFIKIKENIDWDIVINKLDSMRIVSENFLKTAIK